MSIKDGGPAFPVPWETANNGMSLRDWFAGQVDISSSLPLMDRESCEALIGKPMPDDFVGMVGWNFDVVAKLRWMAADAMLAALSGHPTVKQMVAAERDAWREEPESSEAWCAGNQHVLDRLCVVAGADPATVQWDGSDGSLNAETDALIRRILRHNDDDDGLSPRERALVAEAEARGMERAAGIVRSHGDVARTKLRETYDAGNARGNTLWGCIVGHLDIADDAIRAEAAAIRKEETT